MKKAESNANVTLVRENNQIFCILIRELHEKTLVSEDKKSNRLDEKNNKAKNSIKKTNRTPINPPTFFEKKTIASKKTESHRKFDKNSQVLQFG